MPTSLHLIWNRPCKIAVAFLTLVLSLDPAVCATESLSFSVAHWEMKDGLPLNKVRAIVQTRDGYLWVGTFNGLARFDGVQFKTFDMANTPELHNNAIESLCEDREGRLWIGDNLGGITLLENGRFQSVTLPTTWPGKPILRLASGRDGAMWAMNETGLLLPLIKGAAGQPLASPASIAGLATDNAGEVWAVVTGKLCRLDAERGAVPLENGPRVVDTWRALFAAREGGLWILDGDWLRRWQDGKWVADRGRGKWGTIVLPAFLESRSGNILGGSFKEGIYILDNENRTELLDEANGLSHNWAYCLYEDREGNIWVGTGNGGLNVLYPRRVTMVNAPDNWQSSAVLSVSPRAAGGLWIGTEGAGVYQFTEGAFTHLPAGETFWQSVANSVLEDRAGRLWVGTWASGARVMEQGEFRNAYPVQEARSVVLTVFESSRGDIWVGTKGGPGRWRDGQWNWFENHSTTLGSAVRCFAEQPAGSIWFGLDGGGVGRMMEEQLVRFHATDGLASDYVRTMHADADGALWIGTREGLSRFKNGKFTKVTTRHGLPSDVICQILDDGKGHYWMSSLGGIFRVTKSELNRCADGEVPGVNPLVCDRTSGLATLEMSEQGQPAGCRTSDGRLWFATGKGLAQVAPDEVRPNPLPPPVKIEELLVDGESRSLPAAAGKTSPLTVPPGGRQFEFRFTGLSLANPTRVMFRYRLEGLHDDWFEAGVRRSAFYTQLAPGDYIFRVTARNADGLWNEDGAILPLRVLPHYWQTWWFKLVSRGGALVFVGGTVFVIVRRRARRKLEALDRQRAIERERGRIARDIHDDIGSNLTRIVMLSESARGALDQPKQAVADLEEICQTGRELTLQLSEIVWAVNPAHDTLDSFATYCGKYAHDFLGKAGVRCRLDVPVVLPALALDSRMRHNVFLAFKETLNNAVKHSGAKSVDVGMKITDEFFTLTIADAGRGFAAAESSHFGQGLANMKQRLADVGGSCEIESGIGAGTRVCLIVPQSRRK